MAALMLACEERSDVGRRANNEDATYASSRLAAVADGVGGAAAGEIASRTVINALIHLETLRLEGWLERAVADAVRWGNETIGFIAECRPETAGMSTTLTAIVLDDRWLLPAGEHRRLADISAPRQDSRAADP